MHKAFNIAIITIIAVITLCVLKDVAHENDCQAAQDAMHTIAVNVDMFYSVEDMRQAAAPHIEFFTKECTK